jgi:hypothetical protein
MRRWLVVGALACTVVGLGGLAIVSWLTRAGPSAIAGPGAPPAPAETSWPPAATPSLATAQRPASPRTPVPEPPLPANDAVTPLATASPAPARASSRRHRGRAPREVAAAHELIGTGLAAALQGVKPRLERCLPSTNAPVASRTTATTLIRALETSAPAQEQGSFTEEEVALMRGLETSAGAANDTPSRTLTLQLETLEGEVRIADVRAQDNGALDDPFVACAQRQLRGTSFPVPAARPGGRFPVAWPVRLGRE